VEYATNTHTVFDSKHKHKHNFRKAPLLIINYEIISAKRWK